MHDIRNPQEPSNILNLFSKTTSIHSYNTWSCSSNNVYIKKSRLDIQKRAFSRVGAKTWNEIPVSLRELPLGVLLGVHSFPSLTVNVGSSAQVSSFKLQVCCFAIKHTKQEEVLHIQESYYGKKAQGKPLGLIKK